MNEKDNETAMRMAQLSESVGMLFIPAGVVICLYLTGWELGLLGITLGMAYTLPVLGIGLLLIVAARILRAVSGKARSPGENPHALGDENP
jgi:hypothetical protein